MEVKIVDLIESGSKIVVTKMLKTVVERERWGKVSINGY
jgi:hypothetical protein